MSWILIYWVTTSGFWISTHTFEFRNETDCAVRLEKIEKQSVPGWTKFEGICRPVDPKEL